MAVETLVDSQENAQKLIDENRFVEANEMIVRLGNPSETDGEPSPENSSENDASDNPESNNDNPEGNNDNRGSDNNNSTETKESKSYEFLYRGEKQRLQDDDGFLGYGDQNRMKNAFGNQLAHIDHLERDDSQKAKSIETLQARIDMLEEQNSVGSNKDSINGKVNNPAPVDDIVLGNDFDFEALAVSDEEADSFKKWSDQTENNFKSITNKFNKLEENLVEKNKKIEVLESRVKENDMRKEDDKYWADFESFRSNNPTFRTSERKLEDIHKDVESWKLQVAQVYGINDSNAIDNKVIQYLTGNSQVKNELQGVQTPVRINDYFNVSDMHLRRKNLIKEGVLGEKSTLDAVLKVDSTAQQYFNDTSHNGDKTNSKPTHQVDSSGASKAEQIKSMSYSQNNFAQNVDNNLQENRKFSTVDVDKEGAPVDRTQDINRVSAFISAGNSIQDVLAHKELGPLYNEFMGGLS